MMILRGFLKAGLFVFCVWHMIAVALYSLIGTEGYPVLEYLVSRRNIVTPYVLLTSQWQRWNLFSPDPLRRVTQFHIDAWMDGEWREMRIVSPATLGFFQRAPELKLIRRLEEGENLRPLREVYVRDVCGPIGLAPGTRLRLRMRSYVIPRILHNEPPAFWRAWEPEWKEIEDLQTACPETA